MDEREDERKHEHGSADDESDHQHERFGRNSHRTDGIPRFIGNDEHKAVAGTGTETDGIVHPAADAHDDDPDRDDHRIQKQVVRFRDEIQP